MYSQLKTIFIALAIAAVAITGMTFRKQFVSSTIVPARAAIQGKAVEQKTRCRREPLLLKPARAIRSAVDEKDVVTVLCAALPLWNPPTVPSAFHELKLWGRQAVFSKAMLDVPRSGEWLVGTLLDDAACQRNLLGEQGNYLLDSPYGIRIVLMGTLDATRYRGQAHYGQLLKVLGEVGVPASQPVTTSSGRKGTVEDIFLDEIMQYVNVGELEFMATALAYWLPPQSSWCNQFSEQFNFDMLMQNLIDAPWGKGSCGGCHTPYAVVSLLRVDERHRILDPDTRAKARAWVTRLVNHLEQKWGERAGWDKDWAGVSNSPSIWEDTALDRITVTGHHLEWMAMLPLDLYPDEMVVKRAVQGLCADIASLPPTTHRSFKTLLPVSHAARALALLIGVEPFQLWKQYWECGYLQRNANGYSIRGDPK